MNWSSARIREIVERHRITYAVIASLLVAVLLTAVSMALYISSGASRLDLSRPGYERIRKEAENGPEEEAFSANGPLNSTVANDFQKRFTKHRETLNKLDTFGTNALDDTELQIAPRSNE